MAQAALASNGHCIVEEEIEIPIKEPKSLTTEALEVIGICTAFLTIVSGFPCYIIVFTLLLFTRYWFLILIYYAWIYIDSETAHSGGRKNKNVQRWKIWKYAADYFPTRLVKTTDLPADKNYLFCVYPHGILSISSFLNFCTNGNQFEEIFPGIDQYRITLDGNFIIPFCREIYLATGNCASSERSIVKLLTKETPTACALVVGGASESLKAYPGTYRIMLKNRKGFIRLALQTGASVVPVISFGENDIYDQVYRKWLFKIQDYVRTVLGISISVLKGRPAGLYLMPLRHPVTTIVGRPIDMPRTENPSKEMINLYKNQFTYELQKLFNENKSKYDVTKGAKAELIIE